MKNPYKLPNKPRVTIREIVVWLARKPPTPAYKVADHFGITPNDAGVRLRKLHRWGYCGRRKAKAPPRVYHYWLTKFGRTAARRWMGQ
jgi:DNA-binding HxlR family transcriptional regulator